MRITVHHLPPPFTTLILYVVNGFMPLYDVEALFILSIVNLLYMLRASKINISLFSVPTVFCLVIFQRLWFSCSIAALEIDD